MTRGLRHFGNVHGGMYSTPAARQSGLPSPVTILRRSGAIRRGCGATAAVAAGAGDVGAACGTGAAGAGARAAGAATAGPPPTGYTSCRPAPSFMIAPAVSAAANALKPFTTSLVI